MYPFRYWRLRRLQGGGWPRTAAADIATPEFQTERPPGWRCLDRASHEEASHMIYNGAETWEHSHLLLLSRTPTYHRDM